MRRAAVAAVWLGAGVLTLAWALLVLGAGDDTWCVGRVPEGGRYSVGYTLWPPGAVECDIVLPGGGTDREVRFPWPEWALVVAFAAASTVAASAATRSRPTSGPPASG